MLQVALMATREPRDTPPFDPDAEALELIDRLAGRALVVKSVARIAAALLHDGATRASGVVRAYADGALAELGPLDLRRLATAAAEAAVHVTTAEVRRRASHSSSPPARRTASTDARADAPGALDHEALHDDAC